MTDIIAEANHEAETAQWVAAGIEYHGVAGGTEDCIRAIERLLVCQVPISRAEILTSKGEGGLQDHAILLTVGEYDTIAIKSGFGSGYDGEGSHGLSYVLQLLKMHCVPLEEFLVTVDLIERLDNSALTWADLEKIRNMRPLRPKRLFEYICENHEARAKEGTLWQWQGDLLPIPFALIDPRLVQLAVDFWKDPDRNLVTAYRRLEDAVRTRTGLDKSGSSLFSKAFLNQSRKLAWPDVSTSEQEARGLLFTSAFGAFRNPRAHRENPEDPEDQLSEFLLVNLLYKLERAAQEAKST